MAEADARNIAGLPMTAGNDEIKELAFALMEEIRDLCFATSEDDKPAVRIIDLMDIRGDSIYFLTARGKHFYKQLMKNTEVAISGMNKDYISVRVRGSAKQADYITDACIGCGQCQEVCPEDAIEEGSPYWINESRCLECGMCSEICPEDAVVYRR